EYILGYPGQVSFYKNAFPFCRVALLRKDSANGDVYLSSFAHKIILAFCFLMGSGFGITGNNEQWHKTAFIYYNYDITILLISFLVDLTEL
ncbi:hypothetical protein STEG23_037389, partial [Scotinomys teguina]